MQKYTQTAYLLANQCTQLNLRPICLPQVSDGNTKKIIDTITFSML